MTVVEFWVEQYQTVVAEKKQLGDKFREALEENKKLQQQIDDLKDSSLAYAAIKNMETEIGRLKESLEGANKFSDSLQEKLDAADAEKKALQTRLNNSRASNEAYISMNSYLSRRLSSSMHQAQELKTQLEGTKERLDKSIADRSELQADRDIWFRKNGEKQAEIEELKKKIQSLEDDLKSKACSRDAWRTEAERLRKELTESYSNGYFDGNEEGQNELWEMLQLVKDMQPNEFDSECKCLGDIIDMDLEDFKEAYGKWEAEQKKAAEEAKKQHVEYMRSYLKRYCIGKLCFSCPLYNASEPVSSCLFSKLTDEEVEERYRKAIESERKVRAADDPCSGVHEKVKEACDAFAEGLKAGLASEVKEVPVSCDIPIKDLASWECTIEATVEINKDLLKYICGIKPKEEEHKLEYGDAVRLPWCNYDYMYIAPDEKEETLVHLFDPENHAIVTTHISNVRYNGGRILVSEEDDIRKIWKYMK